MEASSRRPAPLGPAALQAAAMLVLVLALHHRLFLEGGLLGAPETDVIRGVWGLDHQARGLPLPFWTERIGFPEGVKILILPFASSLLAAPLVFVFGAVAAYDLWILGLLWLAGVATGWLAREVTGRPWAGLVAGTLVVAQPMMLLAVTDGTPENVAFWGVPALLAALWRALRDGDVRFGALAGLLGFVVAADSPYHAVFAVGLSPLLLMALRRPLGPRLKAAAAALGVAVLGAAALAGLYVGLPVDQVPDSSAVGNAVQVRSWVQWETGNLSRPWDWTLTPSFVPVVIIAGAVALSVLSPLRAAPWLLAALACLLLGLGPGSENPRLVAGYLGAWALDPLRTVAGFLDAHPPPVLRFLRRMLVPFSLCLGIAAEIGLGRFRAGRFLAPLLAVGAALVVVDKTAYPTHLPLTHPPQTAAMAFVEGHEQSGAAVFLPRIRAAHARKERDELPVFAELGDEVRSAAELWLQVDGQVAAVNSPQGLITMVERHQRPQEVANVLRDLDDLSLPKTIGRPIPPSATTDPARRTRVLGQLVDDGLRFVVVDEALYRGEGLALLREMLSDFLVEEQRFDDGSGLVVLVLAPAQ